KRKQNQDRILIDAGHGIFLLADGMGGERCGDLAAELAVETTGDYLRKQALQDIEWWPFEYDTTLTLTQNRILSGVRLANRRVWETGQTGRDCQGRGTTLSALSSHNKTATIGNIGDSRIYLFRDGRLWLLTRDDALVSNLVDAGEITAEEARVHPSRNVL